MKTLLNCLAIILCLTCFVSCRTVENRFSPIDVRLGMGRMQAAVVFGKPYRSQMEIVTQRNGTKVNMETFIYREIDAVGVDSYEYYYVILYFVNEILVKMEQTPNKPRIIDLTPIME